MYHKLIYIYLFIYNLFNYIQLTCQLLDLCKVPSFQQNLNSVSKYNKDLAPNGIHFHD